ncbi:kinase-like domain-containing protein [Thamnocephalis sphaerospora]|nr:kinase-like domain-containing protein [Thamnocephalis sphaerospora]|eukprot:RKP04773.1 kinase-like domain-containing protein [Thamnocephalis sphaerospora]
MQHPEVRGPLFATFDFKHISGAMFKMKAPPGSSRSEGPTQMFRPDGQPDFRVSVIADALRQPQTEYRLAYKRDITCADISREEICYMLSESSESKLTETFDPVIVAFFFRMVDAVYKQMVLYGSSCNSDEQHTPACVGTLMHGTQIDFYLARRIYDPHWITHQICIYKYKSIELATSNDDISTTAATDCAVLILNQLDFVRNMLRRLSADKLDFSGYESFIRKQAEFDSVKIEFDSSVRSVLIEKPVAQHLVDMGLVAKGSFKITRHRMLTKPVPKEALNVMAEATSPEGKTLIVKMFFGIDYGLHEAAIYDRLSHAEQLHGRIPKVVWCGTCDGNAVIVMEKVCYGSRVINNPMRLIVAIRQLAKTLAILHDTGVVHGDICPNNILLIENKHAVEPLQAIILDFGSAKLLKGTSFASNLGKPTQGAKAFLPANSGRQGLKYAADVYSLGAAALFFMNEHKIECEAISDFVETMMQPQRTRPTASAVEIMAAEIQAKIEETWTFQKHDMKC